ncbi:MAG TPA: phosphopantothenoylcysteine decarboxylase [Pirellulaceae bacterium]|nr:phosphopantothenoylcysteine decarboxylase [Pirellulaceae bacterium]HMO91102.1 phosphopantothenoylcysteine decarboxylase [Pirellulaceae bacterium]HMP70550.1 phosphopantothenoylcysteine decarboxylase [Pirellulaceae bacterium]
MARILITSGPTRQYIDQVRYISNASSGQMGAALADAAIKSGHDVVIVSGPVNINYPALAAVHQVESTEEMLCACLALFSECDGAIGAAAPCDYRPVIRTPNKIKKTGKPLTLELIETDDVIASLGKIKRTNQWLVGFALESEDARFRALSKLQQKCCDIVVLNGPEAIDSKNNSIEIFDPLGNMILDCQGTKTVVAQAIIELINQRFIENGRNQPIS